VIRELSAAGIPVGAMVAPIIPGLTDHQLEAILAAVAAAGARQASYVLLRLPHEIKDLFEGWLEAHAPLRAAHVLSLVRACRGGRLNDPTFGRRMRGEGAYAQLIARRFAVARRKHGLDQIERTLRTDLFEPPAADLRQLRLI
jgi:DNA repair photolyase